MWVQLSPCLEALVDLLRKMLRYEPSARIRPKQALEHDFFRDLSDPSTVRRLTSRLPSGDVIVLED